ncbi:MAG: gamma-glutamyl-gamma-aminobutyrate hydrolase family protein [Oligoflexus sp.]
MRSKKHPPKIGISACMWEGDPNRKIFNGRPILYLEESMSIYLQRLGALVYMLPPAVNGNVEAMCRDLDGLVLQGGVDVCPQTYGEETLQPEWNGDARRDAYEIALIQAFFAQKKPILGICRGLQIMNVCFGGSLFQDISYFKPNAFVHRDAKIYEKNTHMIDFLIDTELSKIFPSLKQAKINSVHHQAIKDLAPGFVVSARSSVDGIIEAVERQPQAEGEAFCLGVQWHPEFQDVEDDSLLSSTKILDWFMQQIKMTSL